MRRVTIYKYMFIYSFIYIIIKRIKNILKNDFHYAIIDWIKSGIEEKRYGHVQRYLERSAGDL